MNLTTTRKQLDEKDNQIINILAERMSIIPSVAKYKKENNLPQLQEGREIEIIEKRRGQAGKLNLNPDLIENIFRLIIKDSHRIQRDFLEK